ncbi:MAG: PLP-dependent transferase [Treponema sp.]|jgi:O-acetylhomoserine (thiol)-lyase|nr:PLP-dependent transferase [Treponema sp.]
MASKTNTAQWVFETKQLHIGQEEPDPASDARAVPIYQTTSYVFHNSAHAAARFGLTDPGNIYNRLTNSTQDVLEKRIAALEGGVAALALASGAAAVTYSFLNLAQAGDHIVSAKTIYGGTYNLLAHANKIPLVVDATFTTPYLLRPIEYGADIVIHSAAKFLGGHGTTLGGIIVDSGKFNWEASGKFPAITEPSPSYHGISFVKAAGPAAFIVRVRAILLRDTGAAISPFNAFLLLQGVETLSPRVERHVENTLKVIEYLKKQPKVETIHHPSLPDDPSNALYKKYFPQGAGSIFTFEIKGGAKEAQAFIDNLQIFSLLANVADVKSLVIHPASTTHSQLSETELLEQGIKPNTVRLSIGTENIKDIIADLDQAFDK